MRHIPRFLSVASTKAQEITPLNVSPLSSVGHGPISLRTSGRGRDGKVGYLGIRIKFADTRPSQLHRKKRDVGIIVRRLHGEWIAGERCSMAEKGVSDPIDMHPTWKMPPTLFVIMAAWRKRTVNGEPKKEKKGNDENRKPGSTAHAVSALGWHLDHGSARNRLIQM